MRPYLCRGSHDDYKNKALWVKVQHSKTVKVKVAKTRHLSNLVCYVVCIKNKKVLMVQKQMVLRLSNFSYYLFCLYTVVYNRGGEIKKVKMCHVVLPHFDSTCALKQVMSLIS